jgi:hypothetical protein
MMQSHEVEGSKGFVDDLLTGGQNKEEYLQRVRQLLAALRADHWLISPSKARFGYARLAVLGHVVEAGVIKPDGEKIKAISNLKAPETVRHVRAFLGLVGFYRRFIPKFAKLAKPMINLTKGDQDWQWEGAEQASFDALKAALNNTSWLAAPSRTGRYKIYTDFSAEAMGAALHQI